MGEEPAAVAGREGGPHRVEWLSDRRGGGAGDAPRRTLSGQHECAAYVGGQYRHQALPQARGVSEPAGEPAAKGPRVKIASARTTVVGTPWRELVFLELETDTGLVGTSEVRMVSRTDTLLACVDELAPRHVIGSDPFDVERLAWNIQRAEYDRPGEVSQSALACFDVACWDIMGQSLGVPVWKLLGGKFHERVLAYANGWYQVEREPKKIASLAKAVVAKGYRGLKLDPFGHASAELSAPDRRHAMAIVGAVREAVGPDVQIMLEMHGRFTPSTAAAVAKALEPFDPEWIEEPTPAENPLAYRAVRNATHLPRSEERRVGKECRSRW